MPAQHIKSTQCSDFNYHKCILKHTVIQQWGIRGQQSSSVLNTSLVAQINHFSASGKLNTLLFSMLFRVTIRYSNLWLLNPWTLIDHCLFYFSRIPTHLPFPRGSDTLMKVSPLLLSELHQKSHCWDFPITCSFLCVTVTLTVPIQQAEIQTIIIFFQYSLSSSILRVPWGQGFMFYVYL